MNLWLINYLYYCRMEEDSTNSKNNAILNLSANSISGVRRYNEDSVEDNLIQRIVNNFKLKNLSELQRLVAKLVSSSVECHVDDISCLEISKNMKYIFTASNDSTVRIWSLPHKEHIAALKGHTSSITCLVVSTDNNLFATGSSDKTVRIWNRKMRCQLYVLKGHTRAVSDVKITQNIEYIISGSKDCFIRIWNIKHQTLEGSMNCLKPIRCLAILKNEEYIVAATNKIRIFSLNSIMNSNQEQGLSLDTTQVNSIAISLNEIIVCGCEKGYIMLFNFRELKEEASIQGHTSSILKVLTTKNSKYIVTCSTDNDIKVWTIDLSISERIVHSDCLCPRAFGITEDSQRVIFSLSNSYIRIWDMEKKSDKVFFWDYARFIVTCGLTAKEAYLVTISNNGFAHVWKLLKHISFQSRD